MADFDAPRQSDDEDYGDIGAKDFRFGVTGMLLMVGAAVLMGIFS